MHRSRLSSLIIDCQNTDAETAARFWSAALGRPVVPPTPELGGTYRELETTGDELLIYVQNVDHESRVHLDIETDDVDAEVARLEALGAKKIGFVKRWCVMEAPTGQRFCVLRPQRGSLDTDGNDWP
jgi:hypothetical protein